MNILKLIKGIWNDPVGSKVISVLILLILTGIGASIKSLIGGESFKESLIIVLTYPIKVWILCIIVIAGFILWMVYYYWIKRDYKYDDDKELYKDLIEKLPANGSISFLRDNNFAGFAFRLDDLKELDNYYYEVRNNIQYEFLDPTLEILRKRFVNHIKEFRELISYNTFAIDNELQTIPPEWETTEPEKFWKVVNNIHSATNNLCLDYDELIRECRKRFSI